MQCQTEMTQSPPTTLHTGDSRIGVIGLLTRLVFLLPLRAFGFPLWASSGRGIGGLVQQAGISRGGAGGSLKYGGCASEMWRSSKSPNRSSSLMYAAPRVDDDDANRDSLLGHEGNAQAGEFPERPEGAWKMSRSASVPAGVKPIWIGWLGSDVVDDVDDVDDELEHDDEVDSQLEEPAILLNPNIAVLIVCDKLFDKSACEGELGDCCLSSLLFFGGVVPQGRLRGDRA